MPFRGTLGVISGRDFGPDFGHQNYDPKSALCNRLISQAQNRVIKMVTKIGAKIVTAKSATGSPNRVESEPLNSPPRRSKSGPDPPPLEPKSWIQAWRDFKPPGSVEWVQGARRHQCLHPARLLPHFLHRHAFLSRDGAMAEALPLAQTDMIATETTRYAIGSPDLRPFLVINLTTQKRPSEQACATCGISQ